MIFVFFNFALLVATWSVRYTLEVAALIIANFNFVSEVKPKKKRNAIFSEFTVLIDNATYRVHFKLQQFILWKYSSLWEHFHLFTVKFEILMWK